MCASEPLFASVRVSRPAPWTAARAGSNEYSLAVTLSVPFAFTVTVRALSEPSSSPPQPPIRMPSAAMRMAGRRTGERILCAAVSRPIAIACAAAAALLAGCGGEIEVPDDEQTAHRGAELFYERCSGCHSLEAANAYGSKPEGQLQGGERTNGPNFNVRKESRDDVLYAIRNGGFSGAIMPANIVVGDDAEAVADFLSEYSGGESGTNDPTASGQTGE